MAELLDQNEIDALLTAVEDGEVAGPEDEAQIRVFSNQSHADVEIRPYDFKRPERVSKDQMRALENLHESFARGFGAALSGFLRTIVEVKVANIEQMTFSEFTHSLPNPTCFNLIGADALDGSLCMEISPLIVYPIIDRLLGGSNADLFIPQRPLTDIELRLVSQIVRRAMASLHDAWETVVPLQFEFQDSESNPQLVQIVPPNEVVVVVGFEMKMGGRAGTMSLCIPYKVIEPVMEKLSNQSWGAYKKHKKDIALRSRMATNLNTAHLTGSVVLADTTMKLSELMNLQVGDIIMTEKPAAAPLSLMIGGRRKFIGNIGQYHGNRAFKVQRAYTTKDRV